MSVVPKADSSRWRGLRGSAFEVALAALCFLLAAVTVATAGEALTFPTPVLLLVTPLATGAAALAYRYLAPALGGVALEEIPPEQRKSLGVSAGIGCAAFAASMLGSVVIAWVSQSLLGLEVQEQSRILALFERRDPGELVALGLAVVLLAPLAEELLFRATLFRRLRHWCSMPWAFGCSALLFAAVHGNPSGVVTYVWLALCFTVAMLRSGRVGCAVFVHAANNAATFLLLFLGWQT